MDLPFSAKTKLMQKIFLFFILSLCLLTNTAKAQKNPQDTENSSNSIVAKSGTFQIIYHPATNKTKINYHFTRETLIEIERNRDNKVEKYIWLTPTVQVRILSKEYVASANFIPLSEEKHLDQ